MAYSGSYRPREAPEPSSQPERKGPPVDRQPENRGGGSLSLSGLLKKIEAVGLETDDLLLALVLFLMYRESGDKDLLILLGAMLLS